MRTLCLILAAYLTLLACLPCADATVMLELERATLAEDGHDHPDGEDHCSPLCLCACCGLALTTPAPPPHLPVAIERDVVVSTPVAVVQRLIGISSAPDGQPPRQ